FFSDGKSDRRSTHKVAQFVELDTHRGGQQISKNDLFGFDLFGSVRLKIHLTEETHPMFLNRKIASPPNGFTIEVSDLRDSGPVVRACDKRMGDGANTPLDDQGLLSFRCDLSDNPDIRRHDRAAG